MSETIIFLEKKYIANAQQCRFPYSSKLSLEEQSVDEFGFSTGISDDILPFFKLHRISSVMHPFK
jgi:hypothetical protein